MILLFIICFFLNFRLLNLAMLILLNTVDEEIFVTVIWMLLMKVN